MRQGKRYVLTMVEATTGWLETYPVPHATARNTILGLKKQVLRTESDNGTHFQNNLIDTWAKEHGIEWEQGLWSNHLSITERQQCWKGHGKAERSHLSEPQLVGQVLLSLYRTHGLSSMSMSLLYWGAQNRTHYSRCGLTTAEQRGRIISLDLPSAAQENAGLLCHKGTLLVDGHLGVYQDPLAECKALDNYYYFIVSALDIHCNAFNPVEQGNTEASSPDEKHPHHHHPHPNHPQGQRQEPLWGGPTSRNPPWTPNPSQTICVGLGDHNSPAQGCAQGPVKAKQQLTQNPPLDLVP
ncbi:hypothetical protein QYF61_014610 [Mycteria americana]|uniref:Integrase catalytic domain-containing protein n=1 Tax=Mycteria americana TaxID=33587 RepID=A0AAN7NV45_MYCAM|nr:hypothetical protein QYF61_014610 [Mycteria americana]